MSLSGRVLVPVLNALLVSGGNMLLKYTMTRANGRPDVVAAVVAAPSFWCGLALYSAGFLVWMALVARSEIARVLPLVVGLTFGMVLAGSIAFFGETYGPARIAGIAIIFAGAAVIVWRQARLREPPA